MTPCWLTPRPQGMETEIPDAKISTPLPARTTHQEDLTHAGQRKVNLIWEGTQAVIAVVIVMSNVAAALAIVFGSKSESEFPLVLSSSMFLIIGFYFSRTNHTAIGGVGAKPPSKDEYVGR